MDSVLQHRLQENITARRYSLSPNNLDQSSHINGSGFGQGVREGIAVVGFSLRFPRDAVSEESFWQMMLEGRCASTEIPEDHMNIEAFCHPNTDRNDSFACRGGHFVADFDKFDAPFFSMTAAEVNAMDPLQRGLLETAYRGLENAGIPMEKVVNSRTSVYNGCFTADYFTLLNKDFESKSKYAVTGIATAMLANRLSWFFDLKGPSVNLDSACSSSMMALDLACQGLWSGDTTMSLVCGCNLTYTPDSYSMLANMGMLSPDSRCFSFDHRANGYARGEGFGVLVIKLLSQAINDGDTIRAVIRSTGSNQDGHTPGITQPSQLSQEQLIRETYSKANLSMEPTRFFEAHGTGTLTGDPIEANAIGHAFKRARSRKDPLYVGAVKSNIGHLEGASGIAGIIKSILVLERAVIPPNTNFEILNSKIDAEHLNLKFPLEPVAWPSQGLRRISVNSFGFGGANSHVVLDDAYHYLATHDLVGNHRSARVPPSTDDLAKLAYKFSSHCPWSVTRQSCEQPDVLHPRLLVWSAADEDGITRLASAYSQHFDRFQTDRTEESTYLEQLVYTLSARRSSLVWKSFTVVGALDELRSLSDRLSKPKLSKRDIRLGFLFTGQGAQWFAMGRELLAYDVFKQSLALADDYFRSLGAQWSLIGELLKPKVETQLDEPKYCQPACTALQVALVDLLRSFDVLPTAVIGHSSGEIAAAYSVGAISAESAWKLAYFRGYFAALLSGSCQQSGAMMSVGMSEAQIQPYIDEIAGKFNEKGLVVGCVNSPTNVTVSGSKSQVDMLKLILEAKFIFVRSLRVNVAYHSPQMDQISSRYRSSIEGLQEGDCPTGAQAPIMISSVTGARVSRKELLQSEYWVQNMVSPVRFSDALALISTQSAKTVRYKLDLSHRDIVTIHHLLELGPHSALRAPVRDTLKVLSKDKDIGYSSLIIRGMSAIHTTLNVMGVLHCLGYPVNLGRVNRLSPKAGSLMCLTDLPEYPFDHSKIYWQESRASREFRFRKSARMDLLGTPMLDWNPLEPRWRNFLRVSDLPWIEEHKINGYMLYPGAGAVVMAIEAAKQAADENRCVVGYSLKHVTFLRPLTTSTKSEGVETQIYLRSMEDGSDWKGAWYEFRIYIYQGAQFNETCRGSIRVEYKQDRSDFWGMSEWEQKVQSCLTTCEHSTARCSRPIDKAYFYRKLLDCGYSYGPSFQGLDQMYYDNGEAVGEVRTYQWTANGQPHVIHPTTLDAILQLGWAARTGSSDTAMPTMVPSRVNSMWVSATGLSYPRTLSVKGVAKAHPESLRGTKSSVFVLNKDADELLAHIDGFEATVVSRPDALDVTESQGKQLCYSIEWKPDLGLLDPLTGNSLLQRSHRDGSITETPALARYVDIMAHKDPCMRILQIGIHESLSNVIIDALSRRESGEVGALRCKLFDITSVDAGASKRSKVMFKHPHRTISFKVLDLETDIAEQGYNPGSYDLAIIQIMSKHRVQDTALQNIKQLLVPQGKILITGFTDPDFRAPHTLIPSSLSIEWRKSLARNGFICVGHSREDLEEDGDLMICGNKPRSRTKLMPPKILLITLPDSEVQMEFARELELRLRALYETQCDIFLLEEAASWEYTSSTILVFLLELEQPFLFRLDLENYMRIKSILTKATEAVWVTGGGGQTMSLPEFGTVNGFARALRSEFNELVLVTVALDPCDSHNTRRADHILQVLEATHSRLSAESYEREFRESNGLLHVPRLVEMNDLNQHIHQTSVSLYSRIQSFGDVDALKMTFASLGLLDSIQFIEDHSLVEPLPATYVEIEVRAVGVNFLDCLTALGHIDLDVLGVECSGVIRRVGRKVGHFSPGDRVVACTLNTYRTFVRADARCVARIPDTMCFQEAAAFPVAFITAYHSLVEVARLSEGEKVLIHAGAGGTGQAAIQVAQHLGAEIYVTVGSGEKKRLIEELGVAEDHIFYSRNTSFAQGIRRLTGQGVDVILNSLAGESLVASWECMAPFGRFVEIGKKDIQSHKSLPMFPFANNVSFNAFDLVAIIKERPSIVQKSMQALIKLMVEGKLRRIRPLQAYGVSEIEGAFRTMQSGQNVGKMVIEIRKEEHTVIETKPKYIFEGSATYLIAGGFGGIGRSIARWMVNRGARHLVLLSRSGPSTEAAIEFLKELREQGACIETPLCDVTDAVALKAVVDRCGWTLPPLRGCIQASMIAKSAIFENMPFEVWRDSLEPKIRGSRNLHTVLPGDIDFFIMLSSITGIYGSGGQVNYAAGNSYMDALAHHLLAHGRRAVSLDLGIMASEGYLAEHSNILDRMKATGQFIMLSSDDLFALLDYYCDPTVVLRPSNCQPIVGLEIPANMHAKGLEEAYWMRTPLFRHLHALPPTDCDGATTSGTAKTVDLAADFSSSSSLPEGARIVAKALIAKLSHLLNLTAEEIEPTKPLLIYGLDSLTAVELRNWFAKELRADIAIFDILGGSSADAIGLMTAGKSNLDHPGWT